jgi:nicotinate-nucleotide adenylyltransferase
VRLAIFGGSFDPPHIGHLLASSDACEQLDLDRLIVVPTGTQPLKVGSAVATPAQRLEMAQLAFGDDSRFDVSDVEVRRGGLSFTVDTLGQLATTYPDADRFLLLGLDVIGSFEKWKDPERILTLARPVLLERQNDQDVVMIPARFQEAGAIRLPTRRVDVSATEIRRRVRAGQSIRGFVTEKVAAYIERVGLYR